MKKLRQTSLQILICGSILLLSQTWMSPILRAAEYSVSSKSDELVAAIVFNILKFTTWPRSENLKAKDAKLRVFVLDNQGLASKLEAVTRGKEIDSHPIEVRDVKVFLNREGSAPEVFVLSASSNDSLQNSVSRLKGCNCLTIARVSEPQPNGPIIGLFEQDQRIRFAVNLRLAKNEGIELSSQMLKLGKVFE